MAYNNGNSYELGNYKYSSGEDDFVSFMNEIQDINNSLDQYQNLINLIANKQRQLIQELDLNEEDGDYSTRQVDALVAEAQSMQVDLKNRIKNVQQQAVTSHDQAKIDQAETSRKRFLDLIQEYRMIESNNREQTKQQSERQYKIIKPDATPQEIKAAVEDGDSSQYFQQALMQSNRRGEARTVLNEVQARHRELLKLEKTMAELTQLFHDMEELVVEQDQAIQQIDEQVGGAQHDIEQGLATPTRLLLAPRPPERRESGVSLSVLLFVVF